MTAPEFPLYDVPRRCACGNEWMSKSFTAPTDGEGMRPGTCEDCVAKNDARQDEMTRRAPPVPRPTPKAKTRSGDEYPDERLHREAWYEQ